MDVQASIKRLRDWLGVFGSGAAADDTGRQRRLDIIDVCRGYEQAKADATRYRQGLTAVMGEAAEAIIDRNNWRSEAKDAHERIGKLARRVGELETENIKQRDEWRANEAAMRDSYARLLHAQEQLKKEQQVCQALREHRLAETDRANSLGEELRTCRMLLNSAENALGRAQKRNNELAKLALNLEQKLYEQNMAKAREAEDATPQAPPARCEARWAACQCDLPAGHTGPHCVNYNDIAGISWDDPSVKEWAPKRHELKNDTVTGWSSCAVCQMTTCNPAIHINQPCPGVKR